MRTTSMCAAIAIASTAAVSLWTPGTAKACSAPRPGCTAPVRLFGTGAEVPGNLIRFKVLVDEPGQLTLRTKAGETVAASIKTMGDDRVFSPDSDVATGQALELVYTTVCPDSAAGTAAETVYEFTTWEAQPVSLRPPELVIEEQGIAYPGLANNESTFVRLRYYSPDSTASVLHLMEHHVTVDGETRRLTEQDGIPMLELRSRCEKPDELGLDSCGTVYSYPAGDHEIEAWSTIVGESSEPERATIQVNLDCGSCISGELTGAPAGSGGGSASAGSGSQAGEDAPPPDDMMQGSAAAASSSGCSVSPSGPRGTAGTPLIAIAMALGFGWLRRRRTAFRERR